MPDGIGAATQAQGPPPDLPLLPMKLDDFLEQNGGLTRLKLKMEDATAEEVAAEVKKQTGVELMSRHTLFGDDGKPARFSVEANGEPFWQAVAGWNRGTSKLSLQRDWGNPNRWQMVTWDNNMQGRGLVAGPCYIVASNISLSRSRSVSLDLTANPKEEATDGAGLSLSGSLHVDPRLLPRVLGLIPEFESATDDKGRALEPSPSYSSPWLEESNLSYLSVSLAAPAADARRLRSLKGKVRLAVLSKTERWEIDLAATPKAEKTFKSPEAEVTLRWGGLTEKLNGWDAIVHLERKDEGPRRLFKAGDNGWGAHLGEYQDTRRAIRFLDAEGQLMPSGGSSSRSGQEGGTRKLDLELSINRANAEAKPPAKLVIDVPLEWREIQIPFEFRDLPLPASP